MEKYGLIKSILHEVFLEERKSQNRKWGEQNHTPAEWLMILGEEVGEVNKAALESYFSYQNNIGLAPYREELIQIAAVAVAMIESLDRSNT